VASPVNKDRTAQLAVINPPDDRSMLARATEWASSAMTIAIEMVAPVLIGAWIDGRLGTKGVFAIIGGAIGVTAGIWSLLRVVEPLRRKRDSKPDRHEHPPKTPP
jgi:F0F1-type ATP synthase assembly protein I